MGGGGDARIECNDCQFSRVISPEEDILPAEIIIEHGEETGHILSIQTGIQPEK